MAVNVNSLGVWNSSRFQVDSCGTHFRLTFSRFVNISPDTEVQDSVVQVQLFECLKKSSNPKLWIFVSVNTK